MAISSSVNPYNSYTSASISWSKSPTQATDRNVCASPGLCPRVKPASHGGLGRIRGSITAPVQGEAWWFTITSDCSACIHAPPGAQFLLRPQGPVGRWQTDRAIDRSWLEDEPARRWRTGSRSGVLWPCLVSQSSSRRRGRSLHSPVQADRLQRVVGPPACCYSMPSPYGSS